MRQTDLKKRLFAVEYYKNGCNAKKAAEAVGYSPKTAAQHGYTLLKDEAVKAELEALDKILSLDKLAEPDKDTLRDDVASINDVLTTLTKILRRELTEDAVVVVKKEKTVYEDDRKQTERGEEALIVHTRTKLSDVNRAADLLLKYYSGSKDGAGDDENGGVVILADIRKD